MVSLCCYHAFASFGRPAAYIRKVIFLDVKSGIPTIYHLILAVSEGNFPLYTLSTSESTAENGGFWHGFQRHSDSSLSAETKSCHVGGLLKIALQRALAFDQRPWMSCLRGNTICQYRRLPSNKACFNCSGFI